jgi:hypothetical protein
MPNDQKELKSYLLQFKPNGHKTWRIAVFSSPVAMKTMLAETTNANDGFPEVKALRSLDRLTGEWSDESLSMLK